MLAYGISSNLLSVNVAASVKPPRKQHSTARVDTEPKDEPWTQGSSSVFVRWLMATSVVLPGG